MDVQLIGNQILAYQTLTFLTMNFVFIQRFYLFQSLMFTNLDMFGALVTILLVLAATEASILKQEISKGIVLVNDMYEL